MTPAQRRWWRSLTGNQRRLVMAERPDDVERDSALRASILTALSNVYGPRVWGAELAELAEGEDEPDECKPEREGMSYAEIGAVLGVSVARVRQIEVRAIQKIRAGFGYLAHFVTDAEPRSLGGGVLCTVAEVETAIVRARAAAELEAQRRAGLVVALRAKRAAVAR